MFFSLGNDKLYFLVGDVPWFSLHSETIILLIFDTFYTNDSIISLVTYY